MVTRTFPFLAGEHYHIYNRGNGKQRIFLQRSDYQRFINLLYLSNTAHNINTRNILRKTHDVFSLEVTEPLVKLHAICLMPNHYHLLITPILDDGLSRFMLKVGTGYSMYYNKKYERSGSLFEGRYKAKYADNDEYLKYLFSYIHLNPIPKAERSSVKKFVIAQNYPYSSLFHYLQHDLPRAALGIPQIIDAELLNMYLPNRDAVQREMYDWVQYDPELLG